MLRLVSMEILPSQGEGARYDGNARAIRAFDAEGAGQSCQGHWNEGPRRSLAVIPLRPPF